MICPACQGRRFVEHKIPSVMTKKGQTYFFVQEPCSECIGGVASCCDAAGANYPQRSALEIAVNATNTGD